MKHTLQQQGAFDAFSSISGFLGSIVIFILTLIRWGRGVVPTNLCDGVSEQQVIRQQSPPVDQSLLLHILEKKKKNDVKMFICAAVSLLYWNTHTQTHTQGRAPAVTATHTHTRNYLNQQKTRDLSLTWGIIYVNKCKYYGVKVVVKTIKKSLWI